MARHRHLKYIDIDEEYEGYDNDVYGRSAEENYSPSPSVENFMFDRSKQMNISSCITEPNIEEEEGKDKPSNFKISELPDLEKAKLMSCVEAIKRVIDVTCSESELYKKIIDSNYNNEEVINSLLNTEALKSKNDDQQMKKKFVDTASAGDKPRTLIVVRAAPKNVVKGFDVSSTETSRSQSPCSDRSSPDSAAKDEARRKEKLLTPTASRNVVKSFDLNATDTSRSLSPCLDRNSPNPASKDEASRKDRKLTPATLAKSISPRSQSPSVTGESEPSTKTFEEKRDALAIYKSKRAGCKEQLHLIVVGHVDAGKSTLMGKLLCDLGQVPSRLIHKYQQESKKIGKQSFAYAWVLDETGEERERGITMDIGQSKFETNTKAIILLDAPGHKDFIPNMITGATQADVALLVVDATRGEFETGFDSGGQTREHALLLRSLGVSQIAVVINKLDTVNWSKDRYNEIVDKISVFLKQAGFKDAITYVPCSGLSGENVVSKPKEKTLSSWYTGPTLVEVIDNFKCPDRPVDKPFRFSINDIFKSIGGNFSVSGHMETGMVAVGDKVLILPRNEPAVVKGIQVDENNITYAFAGDQVSLVLSGIDQQNLAIGDIVCSPYNPVPVSSCFQAHVVIFNIKVPITNGMPVLLHQQSLVEPATITKLVAQLNRSTGEVIKKKPRCLLKNTSAIIEITTQRPICVELHKDVKQLGRVTLRIDGTTVAAGLITKIK